MITLTFACGHRQAWDEGGSVVCATCGERRIARTVAPAPRFRGVVVGPSATYDALPGIPVNVGVNNGTT